MLHLDVHGIIHALGGMLVGFGGAFSSAGSSAVHTLDCVLQPHIH